MRKLFSILLVIGMLLAMSITAFAAAPETVGKGGNRFAEAGAWLAC